MKILDALDNIVTEYDRNLYYLVAEKRTIKYDATEATKDKFHFEMDTDNNGRRRLKVVIDERGEQARPAWEMTETFFRLTPFTDEQLADPALMESLRHPRENMAKLDLSKLRKFKPIFNK